MSQYLKSPKLSMQYMSGKYLQVLLEAILNEAFPIEKLHYTYPLKGSQAVSHTLTENHFNSMKR